MPALAAVAMAAAACGTKDAPDPLQPSGPVGRVRFVNLVTDPSRNPVNALLEGLPFGVNLAYAASTPASLPAPSTAFYSAVLAGDRTIVLKKTADTTVTVATLSVNIAANNDYTVYATGGTGGSAVTAFSTADANTPPAAGQARIRVTNMSPAAGAVDVFITAANADLAVATPVATGLANRAAFAGADVAPIEAAGDFLVLRGIGQEIAPQLFDGELIEGHIAVESPDNPIAVRPHGTLVVEMQAVRVAISGVVEPVARHMLAVLWRLEQAVDKFFVRIG